MRWMKWNMVPEALLQNLFEGLGLKVACRTYLGVRV